MLEAHDGDPEHHRRWIWRSHGVHDGWPAASDDPSRPQAKGRPKSFLLAMMPFGRQCCFKVVSMATCCRGLGGPSGLVPGAGEIGATAKQLWTRSLFYFLSRVFFVKPRGLFVISSFYEVLCVRCCMPPL
jgi:hypothetical protein